MLQMRHIYVLFLLLALPLQWGWANSAPCGAEAQVPVTYITLGEMLRMSNPQPAVIAEQTSSRTPTAPETVISRSIFIEDSTGQSEISRWEFEVSSREDIAAQIYAPDWGDMMIDNLSCSVPSKKSTNIVSQSHDPYEVDLPLPISLVCLALCDKPFIASQHPPLPAPVFRAYRPPALTA